MRVELDLPNLSEEQNDRAVDHIDLARAAALRFSQKYPSLVDEFESEAFFALMLAARSFDPGRGVPFRAYARKRVRGALLDLVRRERRRVEIQHQLIHDVIDGSPPPGAVLEDLEEFERRLEEAPIEVRPLLKLLFLFDLTFTEAAEVMGLDPETVADMYRSAALALRDELPSVRFQSHASKPRRNPAVDVIEVILVSVAG